MKKTEPKTYYVRMARAGETDKVAAFYQDNKHHNVRERGKEILKQHIDDGSVVIIEAEDGTIVASSVCYAHSTTEDGKETVKWVEMGSTRIAGLNGFPGVFDIMSTTQILRSYLVEPPEDCFVAHMEHAPIQGIADRLGWRRLNDVPDGLLKSSDQTINAEDAKDRSKDWFRLGVEGLPVMAKYMMDALNKPTLTNKKTGEEIKISFERSTFFKTFKTNIENLAQRNYGSVDTPDLNQGVRQHRDTWLKRRFR